MFGMKLLLATFLLICQYSQRLILAEESTPVEHGPQPNSNASDHTGHQLKVADNDTRHEALKQEYQNALKELDQKYINCDPKVTGAKDQYEAAMKQHDHDDAEKAISIIKLYRPVDPNPCQTHKVDTDTVTVSNSNKFSPSVVLLSALVLAGAIYC